MEFHLVEKINQNSYKQSFDLTKKRHMWKFDELISKNKVTESTLRKLLCKPKDGVATVDKSNIVYEIG